MLPPVEPTSIRLALPDDASLLDRLAYALARQDGPRISIARPGTTVLAFEAATGELMLRSRVIQALEEVVGDDWQALVDSVG
jgi:hypothetical protein